MGYVLAAVKRLFCNWKKYADWKLTTYENCDFTMMSAQVSLFTNAIAQFVAPESIITEYSKRYAYGIDASFYQLTPQLVLVVKSKKQLVKIVKLW